MYSSSYLNLFWFILLFIQTYSSLFWCILAIQIYLVYCICLFKSIQVYSEWSLFFMKVGEYEGCSGYWDELVCWPPAPPNSKLSQPCPQHLQGVIKTSRLWYNNSRNLETKQFFFIYCSEKRLFDAEGTKRVWNFICICSTWQGVGPYSHMEDEKLVINRPSATIWTE